MLKLFRTAQAAQTAPPIRTSVEEISLADIESWEVHRVVTAWRKWRGFHAMPSRDQIALREIGAAATNVSIARVLDEGEDYEFRLIGDAHVQAYGTNYQHKNVSDVIRVAPRFGKQLKASYDLVRMTRRPYALRGFVGMDVADIGFSWFETCYLPFGAEADGVDHIVNTAVYSTRSGSWL